MRILVVAPGLYPEVRGGVEKQAHDLSLALSRSHQVLVFVTLPSAYDSAAADRGYAVTSFSGTVATSWRVNHALEATARRYRPDVILFLHIIGLDTFGLRSMVRRLGAPYVVSVHDYWYVCRSIHLIGPDGQPCRSLIQCPGCRVLARDRMLARVPRAIRSLAAEPRAGWAFAVTSALSAPFWFFLLRRYLLRRFLNDAAALIINSYRVEAIHRAYAVRTDHALVQYPGVPEPESGAEQAAHDDLPATRGSDGPHLLFLGRVNHEKGATILIEALRRLQPPRVGSTTIAGECVADMESRLLAQATAIHSWRVEFSGPYTARELPRLLSRGNVVIIPSVWEEPYAITLEEARQHHKIVVASDTGGMAERVLHGVDGFLFRRADASALAKVLDEVLTLPVAARQQIADRGARRVTVLSDQCRRLEGLLRGVAARDDLTLARQRFGDIIPAVCSVTGLSERRVLERLRAELRQPGMSVREAWNAAAPKSSQEIARFYSNTDAYIFDLLIAHDSWERKIWTKRAIEIFFGAGVRSILDYGGGCGDDALAFSEYVDRVTLLEPGEKTSALAKLRLRAAPQARVVYTVEALGAERFDGIYCTEVLEHVPNPLGLMEVLRERLADHGLMIVTHSFGLVSKAFPSHLAAHRSLERTFHRDVQELGLTITREVLVPGNRFYVLRHTRATDPIGTTSTAP